MDFDRLDSILKERKISRRALAIAVGIPEYTIATAFRRKSGLRVDETMRIADYLGVDFFYLEGYDVVEVEGQLFYTKADRKFLFPHLPDNTSRIFRQVYADLMNEYPAEFKKAEERLNNLVSAFNSLNSTGQAEAVKRTEELAQIPGYRRGD